MFLDEGRPFTLRPSTLIINIFKASLYHKEVKLRSTFVFQIIFELLILHDKSGDEFFNTECTYFLVPFFVILSTSLSLS
jgi:hypothetical protein